MKRNYALLCDTFGKTNVDVCVVNPDTEFLKKQNAVPVNWIEGNVRGLHRTVNEFMGHNYITANGEKELKKIIKLDYSLIWLDSPQYGRFAKYIKDHCSSRVITFAHNMESDYIKIYCKPSLKKPHYYMKIRGIEYNEKCAIECSDKFICISPRDKSSYERKFGFPLDTIFPVTLSDSFKESVECSSKEPFFLFVGTYFMPNIEGVKWLAENVAPKIKNDIVVVGRNMEEILVDTLPHPPANLKVLGSVDDLSEYYSKAAAIVMPIFSGSGMKVKTAEAMMYGKPIVAADEALIGYEVEHIEGIYRCNTPQEFINAMNAVIEYKKYYFEDIRKYYLENCNTEQLMKKAHQMINELIS